MRFSYNFYSFYEKLQLSLRNISYIYVVFKWENQLSNQALNAHDLTESLGRGGRGNSDITQTERGGLGTASKKR